MITYGLHLKLMGFYWDDWPWVWFSHIAGPTGMLKIDVGHRPLSGVVLFIGSLVGGESPLRWQMYNLFLRLGGVLALYWMLNQIWVDARWRNKWISLVFLVYPGVSHQFVSVNSSRHLFSLIPFFLSFGFTAQAWQCTHRFWRNTALALMLALIAMFTTEYYYGLELARIALILILAKRQTSRWREFLQKTAQGWLPYLILLVCIFLWRYLVSLHVNYAIVIFGEIKNQRLSLVQLFQEATDDLLSSSVGAWLIVFNPPDSLLYGLRARILIGGAAIIASVGVLVYFLYSYQKKDKPSDQSEILLFGVVALLVGPLPFWVTGLDPKLSFPNDRLNLPMMLGASFLLVWLIEQIRYPAIQVLLLSLWIGLAVGHHNQLAISYRRDWQYQVMFFQQLTTRIPGLQPGTTIMINEIPHTRSTDNSLIAPLNWVYAPEFDGGELPTSIAYIELRFGQKETQIEDDPVFHKKYGFFAFHGTPFQSIVVYHHPPACLQVMDASRSRYYPLLPPFVVSVLPYSDPGRIVLTPEHPAILPPMMQHIPQPENWCYYFERADLARQRGDWAEVVRLGDTTFALGNSPNHASENIPFIEGYAHVGRWEDAIALTQESAQINAYMETMLCNTWQHIDAETTPSTEKINALQTIQQIISCP